MLASSAVPAPYQTPKALTKELIVKSEREEPTPPTRQRAALHTLCTPQQNAAFARASTDVRVSRCSSFRAVWMRRVLKREIYPFRTLVARKKDGNKGLHEFEDHDVRVMLKEREVMSTADNELWWDGLRDAVVMYGVC